MTDKVDEGLEVEDIKPDKDGKYPESVPWQKYVGLKEAWGKTKAKVTSLEEQVKSAINKEDHDKVVAERDAVKTELQGIKEQSLTEKRQTLIKAGLSEEKVKGMSADALNASIEMLAFKKPAPDLGSGGGGSGELKGSPMQLARQAYGAKN